MTAFSFFILSEKSSFIEKDRYNKHSFVKKEGDFYIFARQQPAGIAEGRSISREYIDFIRSISSEMESPIYILVKELKNKEGESDFSIKKYGDPTGIVDNEKILVLKEDTIISYDVLYKFPFISSEIRHTRC